MVLVGGDGAFRGIGEVQVCLNKVESDGRFSHENFEAGWALFVKHLKERRKTTLER